jgi:single-strand DNA-binding protein
MAGDTTLTVVGNLTADPELRFTQSGAAVASFTVASTPRYFDKSTNEWKDGDALFMRCNVWRVMAENATESFRKGDRVMVMGQLRQRSYETSDGEKRTVMELTVDEMGPSVKFHPARSQRVERSQAPRDDQRQQRPPQGWPASGYAGSDDPWGSAPPAHQGSRGSNFADEPPF